MTALTATADAGSVFSPDWLGLLHIALWVASLAAAAWIAVAVDRDRQGCALCGANASRYLCPRHQARIAEARQRYEA